MNASGDGAKPPADNGSAAGAAPAEASQAPSDGFLINGSVNNGAASPFAQSAAFGNNRRNGRPLYNGNVGFQLGNSALDARSFSLTGQDTPKPAYNHLMGMASFGGPIKLPHGNPMRRPNFVINYQWTRDRNATTQSALMPIACRARRRLLADTGRPRADRSHHRRAVPGKHHPAGPHQPAGAGCFCSTRNRTSPARRYNYQVPIRSITDAGQPADAAATRPSTTRTSSPARSPSSARDSSGPNLFGFIDTTGTQGIDTSVSLVHRFTQRMFGTAQIPVQPRDQSRDSVLRRARERLGRRPGSPAITRSRSELGSAALGFGSGIAGLADGQRVVHAQSDDVDRVRPFLEPRRAQLPVRRRLPAAAIQSPLAAGSARHLRLHRRGDRVRISPDFLLGIPTPARSPSATPTSTCARMLGRLLHRRLADELGLHAERRHALGIRLADHGTLRPAGEPRYRHGFAAVAPVVANNPTGSLTGEHYPGSLVRPDKTGFEPRIGFAWHPILASSLVVRGGYGIYYDTSVYQPSLTQMAQQSPLSKSLSVQNTPENPLTLANGFNAPPGDTPNTFAVDPNFRVGYAQNWQLSVQRDLPGALMFTATYLGIKGTRARQEFLPNTYPTGAVDPCPACPSGYAYLTSNGNSTRMRARSSCAAGCTTASPPACSTPSRKPSTTRCSAAEDRAASLVAQDWLESARRARSFEFRPAASARAAGAVQHRRRARRRRADERLARRAVQGWTLVTQHECRQRAAADAVYFAAQRGTGVTGSIRPITPARRSTTRRRACI